MNQVGRAKIKDKKTKKPRYLKYTDIPFDEKGWIGMNYLPVSFDAVHVWIANKKKSAPAWWNGEEWTGLRLRKGDQIIKWKRMYAE